MHDVGSLHHILLVYSTPMIWVKMSIWVVSTIHCLCLSQHCRTPFFLIGLSRKPQILGWFGPPIYGNTIRILFLDSDCSVLLPGWGREWRGGSPRVRIDVSGIRSQAFQVDTWHQGKPQIDWTVENLEVDENSSTTSWLHTFPHLFGDSVVANPAFLTPQTEHCRWFLGFTGKPTIWW
jgi:hypothetical protein